MKTLIFILLISLTAFTANLKLGDYKRIKSTSVNYTTKRYDDIVFVDVSSATRTITLLPASQVTGKVVTVIKADSSSNYVSVTDGTSTWTVLGQNEKIKLFSVGTSWLEDEHEGAVPAGHIMSFAGATCPKGYLDADGTGFDIVKYAKLNTALGSTWGAGTKPDLRGAFLRGTGSHGSYTRADGGAFAGGNVGGLQNDTFQGHWHYLNGGAGGAYGYPRMYDGAQSTNSGIHHTSSVRQAVTDGAAGTPRTSAETRPFNASVKYCIKY